MGQAGFKDWWGTSGFKWCLPSRFEAASQTCLLKSLKNASKLKTTLRHKINEQRMNTFTEIFINYKADGIIPRTKAIKPNQVLPHEIESAQCAS